MKNCVALINDWSFSGSFHSICFFIHNKSPLLPPQIPSITSFLFLAFTWARFPSEPMQTQATSVPVSRVLRDNGSRDPKTAQVLSDTRFMQSWKPKILFTAKLAEKFSSKHSCTWRRWGELRGSYQTWAQNPKHKGQWAEWKAAIKPRNAVLLGFCFLLFFSFAFWDARTHGLSLAPWFWEV